MGGLSKFIFQTHTRSIQYSTAFLLFFSALVGELSCGRQAPSCSIWHNCSWRESFTTEPIMLKNLQSFCNSWDKDILAHHGRSWDLASKRADPPTSWIRWHSLAASVDALLCELHCEIGKPFWSSRLVEQGIFRFSWDLPAVFEAAEGQSSPNRRNRQPHRRQAFRCSPRQRWARIASHGCCRQRRKSMSRL